MPRIFSKGRSTWVYNVSDDSCARGEIFPMNVLTSNFVSAANFVSSFSDFDFMQVGQFCAVDLTSF